MFEQFFSEIRGNLRLRIGLALVAGIVWLYLILVMKDAYQAKLAEYDNLANGIVRLKSVESETWWPEKAKEALSMQTELEGGLRQNGTFGLAQAAYQDWLNQKLLQSGVTRPAIALSELKEGSEGSEGVPADLWKIKAKVEFDFNPQTFDALMVDLLKDKKKVYVENLHIRKQPIPRVEATLVTYCQKPKGAK